MQFIKNIYLYRPLWGHCYLSLPRDWSNSQNIGLVRVCENRRRSRILSDLSSIASGQQQLHQICFGWDCGRKGVKQKIYCISFFCRFQAKWFQIFGVINYLLLFPSILYSRARPLSNCAIFSVR